MTLRRQSPSELESSEMVRLYQSGLSLVRVASRTGFDAKTVHRQLRERDVARRDTHGR